MLTPLGLDPARPFPRIQNKSLNFIVRLSGKDAFGRDAELAVVQVPRSLPRIIRLPQSASASGQTHFVFLSTVISTFVAQLFSGMKVEGAWQFRVTRNSDLFVDDEEVDNLLRADRRRARTAPLRRGRAPGDFARLPAGHHRLPAASLRARQRTICTRSTARSTSIG